MKRILLLPILFFIALFKYSGVEAQDIADYQFEASIEPYQEIAGGTVITNNRNHDNQFFNNINFGFDFEYLENSYNTIGVSINGYLVLGSGGSNSIAPLTERTLVVSPMGADLEAQNGSSIRRQVIGSAPNRVLVIQWDNYKIQPRNSELNFQVRLYENNGSIEFHYGNNEIDYNLFDFFRDFTANVGINGSNISNFSNRSYDDYDEWNVTNTLFGNSANSTVKLWYTSVPTNGLKFTYTPQVNDLGINIFPNVAELCANQEFIYSLEIVNSSASDNSNIEAEFNLPSGLSFISANATNGIYNENTGIYSIPTLAANETANLEVIVSVDAGMEGSNINASAEILSASASDPNLSNNNASVSLAVGSNSSPQLSTIADQTAPYNGISAPIPFTVEDAETAADDLIISISSSNQTLLPNANITVGGSGENRELSLQPALNQFGTTTVTIELSDGNCPIIKTFEVEVFRQIFNNFEAAKIVVGQPDFTSGSTDPSDIVAPGSNSSAVSVKGVLAVGSQTTNRVLIWNSVPSSDGEPANIVLGQTSFTATNTGTNRSRLRAPDGVAFTPDGNKLIVADAGNHRLLIWNSIPTSNNQPADIVVGQNDFGTRTSGTAINKFDRPTDIQFTASGKMIVTDRNNDRVLVYNKIPTQNNASADLVIGQSDFTSGFQGIGPNRLRAPWNTSVAPDGKLLIADDGNNRVLVYNTIPTTNGASADLVIGQNGFFNNATGSSNSGFSSPGVTVSPNGIVAVADFNNHRALIFNEIPTTNGANADVVLGQRNFNEAVNFNDGDGNTGQPSSKNMSQPYGINFDLNERLYINGRGMNRMMIFGETPSQVSDLSIAFTSDSNTPCVNSLVTYNVEISNNGPNNATNVIVTSALPSGFTPTGFDAQRGTYNQESGFWRIPIIGNGETVTLEMMGTVNVGENDNTITAYASVRSYNQNDSDFSNNAGSVDIEVLDNEAPSISEFDDVILDINTGSPNIDFTVNDANVNASSLTVVASSSDQSLVQDANITLGGGGANRFLQITPENGQFGLVTISVTVYDGTCSTTESFELFVGNVWLGNTTVWDAANNWSAGVPSDVISAVIPSNPLGSNFPVINGTAEVNNLIINENAKITVNAGRNLEVYGNLTNLGSEYTGNGNVTMVGTNTQWIMGKVNGLIINNGNGVNLEDDLSTNRSINIQNGQLYVGNNSLTIRNPISGNANNLIMDATSTLNVEGTTAGISIPSTISTLRKLLLNNGSGLSLDGNIQITDTISLSTGTFNIGSNSLQINGYSESTNGRLASASGSVLTITSNDDAGKIIYDNSLNELSRLVINVENGNFEIENPVTINTQLELIAGKLISSNGLVHVNNTAENALLVSQEAFIAGTLRRCVIAGIDYTLPVGSMDNKEAVEIHFNSMSENSCIDVFFNESGSNPSFVDIADLNLSVGGNLVEQLLDYGYWTINPTNALGVYNYDISVTSKGHLNGNETGNHILLKREDSSADWEILGEYSAKNEDGNFTNPITVSRSNLTGFSDFAIGASSAGPLPVELIYFEAEQKQNGVLLEWSTASEKNNSHFEVQKSANGSVFETIGMVDGNGNSSNVIDYAYTDLSKHGNISYYRLQQFDFDGKSEFSDIVKVEFESKLLNISLSPNPATHYINIKFDKEVGSSIIQFVNASGHIVKKESLEEGTNVQLDISDLSTGYYQIIIWSETEKGLVSSNSKLIKK
ncbi:T9SS type A sorting domain-containing protein [Marivirga tractuosa]|uniref:T9SS type A sorting domain-containing protein n=1 Tax=Marivirga tractuosa TaxID=1006 RepID=UPI0035D0D27A